MESLKFTVFADLHYKKGMYAATVDDLYEVFSRAEREGSSFVVHLGDFCNDYSGSPELVKGYLKNVQGLPVYGIYGNHELESVDNSMEKVTPCLTNDSEVVWGTKDGKLSYETAYYHKDIGPFRLIFTDTNYSLSPSGEYEHNRTCSYGAPTENTVTNALSERQFSWLSNILHDGAEKGMKCIVFSHAAFAEKFSRSADAEKVRALFAEVNAKRKNTVIASFNGHWHANDHEISDGILYYNVNSAKNGCWISTQQPHYKEEHTCPYYDFDSEGNLIGKIEVPLNDLRMGKNTWFFEKPLSVTVTVLQDGTVKVEGIDTRWMWDVHPVEPRVTPYRTPHTTSVAKKG